MTVRDAVALTGNDARGAVDRGPGPHPDPRRALRPRRSSDVEARFARSREMARVHQGGRYRIDSREHTVPDAGPAA